MPSQWDHKADKDLLLTIIEDGNLTHIDWQSVAAKLRARDYTFSHEACRQHYQKIRKESRNYSGSTNSDTSITTPKSTKRNNTKAFSQTNGGDEEDLAATPSIKRKRSLKKEKTVPQVMGGLAGQTATQFEVEHLEGRNSENYRNAVDLSDDGIYGI